MRVIRYKNSFREYNYYFPEYDITITPDFNAEGNFMPMGTQWDEVNDFNFDETQIKILKDAERIRKSMVDFLYGEGVSSGVSPHNG